MHCTHDRTASMEGAHVTHRFLVLVDDADFDPLLGDVFDDLRRPESVGGVRHPHLYALRVLADRAV
jgi:hypothetical protein